MMEKQNGSHYLGFRACQPELDGMKTKNIPLLSYEEGIWLREQRTET